ncbi:MAG: archease [Deltaproteobacteria bacterium]|nr:archease [Deltaproteobacteria bacterium]
MAENKIEYERLEHKADAGFAVEAHSLERLYINAALALTDMLVPQQTIQELERRAIEVQADDRETLMVRWLNEILFFFEKDKFLAKRILFENFDGKHIESVLWGDTYDPIRHGLASEIKAATYHQLKLSEVTTPELKFRAEIFVDL